MDDFRRLLAAVIVFAGVVYGLGLTGPRVYEGVRLRDVPVTWTVPGRGLSMASHALTGSLVAAHGLNVALHLVNGGLVYALGVTLASPVVGLVAASLFLVLPLNSEAVQYLAARSDLLMSTGALVAVWLALGVAVTTSGAIWRLLGLGAALLMAAMSQEIGLVAIVLVMLTLAIWRHTPQSAFVLNLIIGVFGLTVGIAGHQIAAWVSMAAGSGGTFLTWPHFALVQLTALWRLLVFWPLGLSIDHDMLALTRTYGTVAVLATAGVLGLAWMWRSALWMRYTLGWIAICVGPRFVFATNEFLNEHDLYLASVGLCLGVSVYAQRWLVEPLPLERGVTMRLRHGVRVQ